MLIARRLARRLETAQRKAFAHAFSKLAPYVVVNEYPKSGGSWLSDMLTDALGYRSTREGLITLNPSIVNGHFLRPGTLSNVVVLWRDPRDVMVSFYHHCYFRNEHRNASLVSLMKARRPFEDYTDVKGNLPAFIAGITERPIAPAYNWLDFAARWAGRENATHTSYEALRHDTSNELRRIVAAVAGVELSSQRADEIAEARSFARTKAQAAAKASKGVEISFVREGSTGGWSKYFTPEAIRMMRRLGYGAPMVALGYEL